MGSRCEMSKSTFFLNILHKFSNALFRCRNVMYIFSGENKVANKHLITCNVNLIQIKLLEQYTVYSLSGKNTPNSVAWYVNQQQKAYFHAIFKNENICQIYVNTRIKCHRKHSAGWGFWRITTAQIWRANVSFSHVQNYQIKAIKNTYFVCFYNCLKHFCLNTNLFENQ